MLKLPEPWILKALRSKTVLDIDQMRGVLDLKLTPVRCLKLLNAVRRLANVIMNHRLVK